MRKYLFIFSLLAVMLFSISTAFAANEKATMIDENYNLNSIKTLAVATPHYEPSALSLERKAKLSNAPELITPDMLVQTLMNVAKEDKVKLNLLTDKQVNAAILKDTGTDIATLNRRDAQALYKANVKNYADAYVVFTFANDSRVVMFADIYDAKDGHWIYSYKIIGGGNEDDNLTNYNMFMHKFFRTFELQAEAQTK